MQSESTHPPEKTPDNTPNNQTNNTAKIWCVYILECADTSFYIGITNQLDKRIKTHNAGKGGAYTKIRRPVVLRWHYVCETSSMARRLEPRLKTLTRPQKEKLLAGNQQKLVVFLAEMAQTDHKKPVKASGKASVKDSSE